MTTSLAKAFLTFRYIEVGGAFRRVRFALACRTVPLCLILRQNSRFVYQILVVTESAFDGFSLARCAKARLRDPPTQTVCGIA
jgi:hypothetical protein